MELERWAELSAAISAVAVGFGRHKGDQHTTAVTVRVHTWAALHDRPVSWACDPRNWKRSTRPAELPDQSTMSRRTRREDFMAFLERVGKRLNGKAAAGVGWGGSASEAGGGGGGGEGAQKKAAGVAQPQHRPRRHLEPGREPHEPGV